VVDDPFDDEYDDDPLEELDALLDECFFFALVAVPLTIASACFCSEATDLRRLATWAAFASTACRNATTVGSTVAETLGVALTLDAG
jgi:hypothetical protein